MEHHIELKPFWICVDHKFKHCPLGLASLNPKSWWRWAWDEPWCCLRQAILIFKSPLGPGDFQRMRVIFDPKLVLTKPSLSGSGRGCGTELCPRWATHHLRRYFTTCRFDHILFLTTSLPHQQYQWVMDIPPTRRALENNCCGYCSQTLPLIQF